MGRAERIAGAALAKDLWAPVFGHRVVAGQVDRPLGYPVREDEPSQGPGQLPGRPAALGEDPVIAGGMARGEGTDRPQEVQDRPSPVVRMAASRAAPASAKSSGVAAKGIETMWASLSK